MTLNHQMVKPQSRSFVEYSYSFIDITPRSTLTQNGYTCQISSIGEIEPFKHLNMCKQMSDVKFNS